MVEAMTFSHTVADPDIVYPETELKAISTHPIKIQQGAPAIFGGNNSIEIEFTNPRIHPLNGYKSMTSNTFSVMQPSPQSILELPHHPSRNPYLPAVPPPPKFPPQPQATMNLLPLSIDSPFPDSLYRGTHTARGLVSWRLDLQCFQG